MTNPNIVTVPAPGLISHIPGTGPTPMVKIPNEPAETEKQYTLAQVDPVGPFNGLFYGQPGSWKTVTTATLPPPFRWLDLDRGLKSIRWAYSKGITSLRSLNDLVAYTPTENMNGRYPNIPAAFDKATDMLNYWVHQDKANWETLVIDSVTEWNMLAIFKGLHLNGMYPDKKRPLSHSDSINEQAREMLITGEQDYKSAMGIIQSTVDELRAEVAALGKNLVMIAHEWTEEETDKEGRSRIVKYLPLLIGQLRTRIIKSFDDVWRFELSGGKAQTLMVGDYRYVAKTRWGDIPKIQEGLDYREKLALVKEFHGIK